MPANFPYRIKRRRKELGLSQDALAKACEVGQSTVANWERGGHIPRQATIGKIATALKTDEAWLLSGERANTRGPINTYLTRPIHHVAVFDWPENTQMLNDALPRTYIAITTEHNDLLALVLKADLMNFKAGTVLVFTRNYDNSQEGSFLNLSEDGCTLENAHCAETIARLIYSFSPH